MSGGKRANEEATGEGEGQVIIKRHKPNENTSSALVKKPSSSSGPVIKTLKRTSGLHAPIMHLTGHEGPVYSCRFSPSGETLASASGDKSIFLWKTYGESCDNFNSLHGHSASVLDVAWLRDGAHLVSASADKTLGLWDPTTSTRIRRFKSHTAITTSLAVSPRGTELVASVDDAGSLKIWDVLREKSPIVSTNNCLSSTSSSSTSGIAETCVCWSQDAGVVFVGGVDNQIKAWDVRQQKTIYTLASHTDTLTSLRLSPDGTTLLSNSMDNTIKLWDVKPFAAVPSTSLSTTTSSTSSSLNQSHRLTTTLQGAPHGFEKNLLRACWSPDGDFVAAGSGDRSVVVWDVGVRRIVYKLPGHKGVVNDVDWHPREPIVLSGSNDRTMFLGEINPAEVR